MQRSKDRLVDEVLYTCHTLDRETDKRNYLVCNEMRVVTAQDRVSEITGHRDKAKQTTNKCLSRGSCKFTEHAERRNYCAGADATEAVFSIVLPVLDSFLTYHVLLRISGIPIRWFSGVSIRLTRSWKSSEDSRWTGKTGPARISFSNLL